MLCDVVVMHCLEAHAGAMSKLSVGTPVVAITNESGGYYMGHPTPGWYPPEHRPPGKQEVLIGVLRAVPISVGAAMKRPLWALTLAVQGDVECLETSDMPKREHWYKPREVCERKVTVLGYSEADPPRHCTVSTPRKKLTRILLH